MHLKTLHDIDVRNKTVLMRVDFNIELEKDGTIASWEEFKIKNIFSTLEHLLKKKCRIILLSHRGRPKGSDASLSLGAIFRHFEMLIRNSRFADRIQNIFFAPSVYQIRSDILKPCTIVVAENIRFHSGEELGDLKFAKGLAALGDVYVNDAFADVHRKHATMSKLPDLLPSCAGLALEKEFNVLNQIVRRPRRPFTVILAGGKADTKFPLITEFLRRADFLFVGGVLANTLFKSAGYSIGSSLYEKKLMPFARQFIESPRILFLQDQIIPSVIARSESDEAIPDHARFNEIARLDSRQARQASQDLAMTNKEDIIVDFEKVHGRNLKEVRHRLLLPFDVGVGIIGERERRNVIPSFGVDLAEKGSILDVGPKTSVFLSYLLKRSGEVLWNGPLGYFEDEAFSTGTSEFVRSINQVSTKTVIGGGETLSAFYKFGGKHRRNVSISSGGGAMLEFFLNQRLPGLVPLMK